MISIITNKRQDFKGTKYYLCGRYFQRDGQRLHRKVWEFHNGTIPQGFDIHHKDHDPTNNQIENLELLPETDHHVKHGRELTEEQKDKLRINMRKAMLKAIEWHKSKAGSKWHKKHGKETWENRVEVTRNCIICGKEYRTPFPTRSKYCHNNCRQQATRNRRKMTQV